MRRGDELPRFRGFGGSGYIAVVGEIVAHHQRFLEGTELKVLHLIAWRTIGAGRAAAALPLSEISAETGLGREMVLRALSALAHMGLIHAERQYSAGGKPNPTIYTLVFADPGGEPEDPAPVDNFASEPVEPVTADRTHRPAGPEDPTDEQSAERQTESIRPAKDGRSDRSERSIHPAPIEQLTLDGLAHGDARAEILSGSRDLRDPHSTRPETRDLEGHHSASKIVDNSRALTRRTTRQAQPIDDQAEESARSEWVDFVEDFAREFRDQAPLSSSVTRMARLYLASGLSIEDFREKLYTARVRTKERIARSAIRKQVPKVERVGDREYVVPKTVAMPYYFAVLADLVGLSNRPAVAS